MGNAADSVELRLPATLHARIAALAEAAGKPVEEVIATALEAACAPDARKLQTLYLWCKAADGQDA